MCVVARQVWMAVNLVLDRASATENKAVTALVEKLGRARQQRGAIEALVETDPHEGRRERFRVANEAPWVGRLPCSRARRFYRARRSGA